jgi:ABC-2 type transport system permease protein
MVVVGKFLALGSVLVGMLLIVNLGTLLYARHISPDFTGSLWWITFARSWAAGSLFALGYLGLTILCSTLATPPSLALALNLLSLLMLWIMSLVGGSTPSIPLDGTPDTTPASPWAFVQWLTPSHYGPFLLDPDAHRFLIGAAAFAVFIVLFVGGAAASLQRRDV